MSVHAPGVSINLVRDVFREMMKKKSGTRIAEEQFEAVQKRAVNALAEKEQSLSDRTELKAKLRARRKVKETADKLAAARIAQEKLAKKRKKK